MKVICNCFDISFTFYVVFHNLYICLLISQDNCTMLIPKGIYCVYIQQKLLLKAIYVTAQILYDGL